MFCDPSITFAYALDQFDLAPSKSNEIHNVTEMTLEHLAPDCAFKSRCTEERYKKELRPDLGSGKTRRSDFEVWVEAIAEERLSELKRTAFSITAFTVSLMVAFLVTQSATVAHQRAPSQRDYVQNTHILRGTTIAEQPTHAFVNATAFEPLRITASGDCWGRDYAKVSSKPSNMGANK